VRAKENGPPKKVEGRAPHHRDRPSTTTTSSLVTTDKAQRSSDIAPDIDCPRCGPVIVCLHTMYYVKPNPTRSDIEWTDSFLENMRRYFGAERPAATTSRPRPADIAQPGKNPAYVAAAIRDELQLLADAREGERNTVLNNVALKVFSFVKGGHADKQACWDELKRIGSAIGCTDSEMVGAKGEHGTLGSAWKGATPRQVPAQVTEL
jgi:hypothetical protein